MSAVCTDESVRMLVAGPGKFSHEKQKGKLDYNIICNVFKGS